MKKFNCSYCGLPITENEMGFDEQSGLVYHIGTCSQLAHESKSMKSDEIKVLQLDYITREQAELLEGKLA